MNKTIFIAPLAIFLACSIHTGKKITVVDYPSSTAQVIPQGSYTSEEISKSIGKRMNRIALCYDKGLSYDRDLGGEMLFQWNILPNGEMADLKIVESRLKGLKNKRGKEYLEECVFIELSKVKFPKRTTESNSTVIYPFAFIQDKGNN